MSYIKKDKHKVQPVIPVMGRSYHPKDKQRKDVHGASFLC